ncbi:OmpA family protein [Xanthobacter sp. TB0139]|uniref:OmpA family protein n=1 Tax=Xanthobacter sp. TB0139 TaxID=3459178 RepID=UPI004039BE96
MAREKVRKSLEDMFGVRVVRDATTLLPERRPFTFSAVKDGKAIALAGYVPSVAARERIISTARQAGFIVSGGDQLVRARGAPPGDFAALVNFSLKQLEQLPSGRITIADHALSIEGRAPDLKIYDELAEVLRGALPYGLTLARFAVRPPVASPFLWSASREGNTLRLSGYVPSEAARADVKAILDEAMPGLDVRDDTHLADGAPSTDLWLKAVRFAADLLSQARQLQVSIADSGISVEGIAATFDMFDVLSRVRRNSPEGFQVARFAVQPPRAVPFVWKLQRLPDSVQMSGYAPSEETRRLLSDALRSAFPGVPIRDEMRLASGGPSSEMWAAAANFAVAQLARLRSGRAEARGARLILSGEALDSAAFSSLTTALEHSPAGLTVENEVNPPRISPYVFSARRDKNGITLSGFYPTQKAHDYLRQILMRGFPEEAVTDVSAIGAGAPEGFQSAVEAGLRQLERLQRGDLSLTDLQLRLSGLAFTTAAADHIRAVLEKSVKPPFNIDVELSVVPEGAPVDGPECQAGLSEVMAHGTILFDTGSASIDAASQATLDRLVYILQRCANMRIEVAGHTDSQGFSRSNQRLSETRAQAVVDVLEAAGVSASHLEAVGYGATQPVVSNETEEGRAKNRRIEFLVKEAQTP